MNWWALVFVVMDPGGDIHHQEVWKYFPPSERWRCESAVSRAYANRRSETFGAYCARVSGPARPVAGRPL